MTARPSFRARLTGTAACLLAVAAAGCDRTEQISRYAVPKEPQVSVSGSDNVEPLSVEQGPATAWFFKLLGPSDAVSSRRDEFGAIVGSTRVSGDSADWTLPDGWSQQSGSQMRFATLTVEGSDPPLEVSVTKLPLFGDREDYLMQNINRWRGQLGLPPQSGTEWLARAKAAGELEQSQTASGELTRVDIAGTTDEFDKARMLGAILLPESRPAAVAPPAAAVAPAPSSPAAMQPLTYQAPDEWQPGQKSMLRVAAFQVAEGDRQVEITVIPAGGDLLDNVNRWRGQVGLDPWNAEELQQSAEELTVDGESATYVSLEGSEQTILAAILPGERQSWFFKLMGDTRLAQREADRFKAFVQSVHLK